ncbi:hypothetical protein ACFV47_40985 [Streptomyces solisilvae]|uniref:hypothetical protein n=1 Tax=Streptomyces malaysiensis TaxID=92644 RepID=UPI002043F2B6|nr:hypothetical protein [Streptomyces sp. DR7-3]MCM3809032.1 hypothetical protein [Streptomyces sp. DR7-3]
MSDQREANQPVIIHATPIKRDVAYDDRAQQTSLPIALHRPDGGTEETILILTPGEVELYAIQLEQAIARRESARERRLRCPGPSLPTR